MIYRYLYPQDRPDPETFDAFNITPGAHDPAHVNELLSLGKTGHGYFCVQQVPCAEWDDGEDGYMRLLKSLTPLTAPDGRVALFPWFPCANGDRHLVAWGDFEPGTIVELAEALKRTAARYIRPLVPMLDMTWPKAPWWMFRADGPQRTDWPESYWTRYAENMIAFIRLLGNAPARPLCNGDRDLRFEGMRLYLEHADYPENWARDFELWKTGSLYVEEGHLLSLTPTAAPAILLDAFAAYRPHKLMTFDPVQHPLSETRYAELKRVDSMRRNSSLWA